MKHLWRGSENQGSIIEINVLAEYDYLLILPPVPYFGIRSPYKTYVGEMLSLMAASL